MNLKYIFGAIISFPLLPIIYAKSKKLRKKTLKLPEAREPSGYIKVASEKTLKIIAIGEHTVSGIGVDFHKNGFIGTLAKEISSKKKVSVLWKVYAESNYTARLIRSKIIPRIEETNADAIVIGLGYNDAFKLNSPSLWIFQINLLIKDLKKRFPKTPIYFTNMPPIKGIPAFNGISKFVIGNLVEILGEKLNQRIKKKSFVHYNANKISLKNWQQQITNNNNIFFSDAIHPSKLFYQFWGKDMANFIINTRTFKLWMQKK